MNYNRSATKQRLHPQSVAEISRHSLLSGDRIRQCGTSSGSRRKDRSVSVSRHFFLQAPQCPCSARKWFSRDHCCRGRSKPCCRIVGSHTRWELTTTADFQLCLQLVSVRRASDPKVNAQWPIFLCCWHQGLEQSAAHCHCGIHSVIIPSIPEISSVHKVVSIMTITLASWLDTFWLFKVSL